MFLMNVIFAAPLGTIVDLYRKQHCKTVSLDKYENKGTCFGFGVIHADSYSTLLGKIYRNSDIFQFLSEKKTWQ